MNTIEFRALIHEAFESHTAFDGRNHHTVNELLYVLEHDDRFKDFNFNISVESNRQWTCIPALDCFVPTKIREVRFYDSEVEFEDDEWDGNHFHNVTVHDNR